MLKNVNYGTWEFENPRKDIQVEIDISLLYSTMDRIILNKEITIELNHKIGIDVFFDGKKKHQIVGF